MTETRSTTPNQQLGPEDHIKDRLRECRDAKEMTQTDLHKRTGLSRTVLAGYESGRHKPGARELRLICDALEVSPSYLIYGTEEPFAKKTGLAALFGMKSNAAVSASMMLIIPGALALLQETEREAIGTLIAALIRSRDAKALAAFDEMLSVLGEQMGKGTQEELTALALKANDPEFVKSAQNRITKKLRDEGHSIE